MLFLILSGRVETPLGRNETVCKYLVEYLILFPMVEKLSKSIKKCHSYSQKIKWNTFHSLRCNEENFHDVQHNGVVEIITCTLLEI